MKRFIYPSPFPTPPIERQLPEEQVSLGPFTLAEAVRIFWSLKSLDLDMSLTVNYATEYGDPLNIKAHYNDLHPSADSIAAREPIHRYGRMSSYMFLTTGATTVPPFCTSLCGASTAT